MVADIVPLNVVKLGNTGSPLLMLHGWGQSLNSLRPLGELLSAYRQVYLIDLPGFGGSQLPPQDWNTADYAQCILKYMDHNAVERADLLGHSFGGRICLRLSGNFPERVSKLVLIGSHGLQRKLSAAQQLYRKAVPRLGRLLKSIDKIFKTGYFEQWFVPQFGSPDYKAAGAMRNILVKTVNEDQTDSCRNITSPALLLWGQEDTETPPEMAQRLHELIRNSQLILLPHKDHFPFFGEGAHLCASYIRQFLMSGGTTYGGTLNASS